MCAARRSSGAGARLLSTDLDSASRLARRDCDFTLAAHRDFIIQLHRNHTMPRATAQPQTRTFLIKLFCANPLTMRAPHAMIAS